MMKPLALALITILAACYGPDIGDCQYACSPDVRDRCPDGFTCNAQSRCVNRVGTTCNGGSDGGPFPGDAKSDSVATDGVTPGDVGPAMDGLPLDATVTELEQPLPPDYTAEP